MRQMKCIRMVVLLLACGQASSCVSVADAPPKPQVQADREERVEQLRAMQQATAAAGTSATPAAREAPPTPPRRAVSQLPAAPLQPQSPPRQAPALPQTPAAPQPLPPSKAPVPVTSCDPGGCWDANTNRYSGGAGGSYLNKSGKLCQRQGAWMQCF